MGEAPKVAERGRGLSLIWKYQRPSAILAWARV
jgi:hypothetical protein